MKKIEILCVGKIKEAYFAEAVAEYGKRLSRFCDFSVTEIPDAPDNILAADKESAAILHKADGYKVLLDLSGEPATSEGFAKWIDGAFVRGAAKVQIIIGGSRGVSDTVKRAADKIFSFGRVTYPHKLMRVIAAEQVYRAMCILHGTPYHK